MATAVKAVYEKGVFKPREPVTLKEQTEVEVLVPSEAAEDDDDPTGWKAAERFVGFIKTAPPGESIAEDHDKHIYK
jgi:predicted DNA-binding antitoxin AbrB/MazE fold protein